MRARKICSNRVEYERNTQVLINTFSTKEYDKKETGEIGNQVARFPREKLLTATTKKTDDIVYISTYDTHAEVNKSSIRKAWHMLGKDPKCGRLFEKPPKFLYHKGLSIANPLVKSDIKTKKPHLLPATTGKGTFPCNNCQHCSSVIKGSQIYHPTKGSTIPVKGYFTRNSENVVYLLKCPCGMAYVGQTSPNVKVRLNEHKSNIRLYASRRGKDEPVINPSEGKKKFG